MKKILKLFLFLSIFQMSGFISQLYAQEDNPSTGQGSGGQQTPDDDDDDDDDDVCQPWDLDCNPDGPTDDEIQNPPTPDAGQGSGGPRSLPISDYYPLLLVAGVAIGGLESYRRKNLVK